MRENPEIADQVKDKILAAGGFDDILAARGGSGTAAETEDDAEAFSDDV